MLLVREGDLFVLFHRTKQDEVGENLSSRNPAFQRALTKHLELLREDLAEGRIEAIRPDTGDQTPVRRR